MGTEMVRRSTKNRRRCTCLVPIAAHSSYAAFMLQCNAIGLADR
jgi:hypothetical protein